MSSHAINITKKQYSIENPRELELAEMDLASQNQIPVIDLSTISPHCARGIQGWHHLCLRVREACETFGCFEVVYDQISMHLRTQTFSMIRQVFQLPSEIKKKNFNPKPYHGYAGQLPVVPLYESLGIEDASNYDSLKGFTQHLWPHGHQQFWYRIMLLIFFIHYKKLDL